MKISIEQGTEMTHDQIAAKELAETQHDEVKPIVEKLNKLEGMIEKLDKKDKLSPEDTDFLDEILEAIDELIAEEAPETEDEAEDNGSKKIADAFKEGMAD